MTTNLPLKLETLPQTLSKEEAITLELIENTPIFKASQKVQTRIETLLEQLTQSPLTPQEEQELDDYEQLDDYLSLVNRTIRNLYLQYWTRDMTINRYLSLENLHQIRKRANDLCEYCHTSEKWQYVKFTIDHVIPLIQRRIKYFNVNSCYGYFEASSTKQWEF